MAEYANWPESDTRNRYNVRGRKQVKKGDLVRFKYDGTVRLVTKIEVRRSVPSNRMVTWAHLLEVVSEER